MARRTLLAAERWSDVYHAVTEKENNPDKFNQVYIGKIQKSMSKPVHRRRKTIRCQGQYANGRFALGPLLPDVFLSRREAQVIFLICEGATNTAVAKRLRLSVRTVEYYINNVRKKTHSPSKSGLIQLVLKTRFFASFKVELLDS